MPGQLWLCLEWNINKTLPAIKFPGLTTWKELLGRFHKQRETLNSQLISIHFCTTPPILSSDLQKNSPSNLSRLAVGNHQGCRMLISLCISGLRQCCRSLLPGPQQCLEQLLALCSSCSLKNHGYRPCTGSSSILPTQRQSSKETHGHVDWLTAREA